MIGSNHCNRVSHTALRASCVTQRQAPQQEGLTFRSMDDLVLWCCNNRRFLEYLVGRRYMAEKKPLGSTSFRGNQYTNPTSKPGENTGPTAQRIADELGISQNSVKRAEAFADGLDAADKIVPGITYQILSGIVTPSKKAVIAVGRETDPQKQRELALALLEIQPMPDDDF